jgi:hypothetical protein
MIFERITALWLRIKALLRLRQLDRDLNDELQFHLVLTCGLLAGSPRVPQVRRQSRCLSRAARVICTALHRNGEGDTKKVSHQSRLSPLSHLTVIAWKWSCSLAGWGKTYRYVSFCGDSLEVSWRASFLPSTRCSQRRCWSTTLSLLLQKSPLTRAAS